MEAAGEPEQVMYGETPQLLWVGVDNRGIELELIGIALPDGSVLIIHAMPRRWRRPR